MWTLCHRTRGRQPVGTVCFGEKRAGYPPRAKRLWDGRDTPLCPSPLSHPRLVGRKGYSPLSHNKQEEAAIADDLCHILVPPGGLEPSTFRSGGERSNPLSYRGLCADEYSPKQPTRLKKPSTPQVVYLQHINYEQVIARDKAVLPCSHQQFADSPARRRKEATPCL